MSKKMLAWSKRLSQPWVRGDQVPRWYVAETVNSSVVATA